MRRCRTGEGCELFDEQNDQVDREEDDDDHFQPEHAAVIQVTANHRVEAIEFSQTLVYATSAHCRRARSSSGRPSSRIGSWNGISSASDVRAKGSRAMTPTTPTS